jgi:hypothetical protein
MKQTDGNTHFPKMARHPVFRCLPAPCLAALLGFILLGILIPASAQNVFDLAEVNGDLRILGEERYDSVGEEGFDGCWRGSWDPMI